MNATTTPPGSPWRLLALVSASLLATAAVVVWLVGGDDVQARIAASDMPAAAAPTQDDPGTPTPAVATPPAVAVAAPPLSAADAAAALQPWSQGKLDAAQAEAAIDALVAWLAADPRRADALAAWIRDASPRYDDPDRLSRIALAALGAAGTPAARAALRGLCADRAMPDALRLHAVMHLGRSRGVDGADVAALQGLAAERAAAPGARSSMVAGGALATLGRIAGPDGGVEPMARTAALQTISAALQREREPHLLASALHGAAAAREPSLLPSLLPLVGDPDLDVRAAAAEALVACPGGLDTPAALAAAAATEAPRVRLQVLEAALAADATTPLAAFRALAVAGLPSEPNAAVAKVLVALAGRAALAGDEAARAALRARFAAETGKGGGADAAMLRAIGSFVGAAELAAVAGGGRP